IRDYKVTGVQTCALPICGSDSHLGLGPRLQTGNLSHQFVAVLDFFALDGGDGVTNFEASLVGRASRHNVLNGDASIHSVDTSNEIGRASCRERVEIEGVE